MRGTGIVRRVRRSRRPATDAHLFKAERDFAATFLAGVGDDGKMSGMNFDPIRFVRGKDVWLENSKIYEEKERQDRT